MGKGQRVARPSTFWLEHVYSVFWPRETFLGIFGLVSPIQLAKIYITAVKPSYPNQAIVSGPHLMENPSFLSWFMFCNDIDNFQTPVWSVFGAPCSKRFRDNMLNTVGGRFASWNHQNDLETFQHALTPKRKQVSVEFEHRIKLSATSKFRTCRAYTKITVTICNNNITDWLCLWIGYPETTFQKIQKFIIVCHPFPV